MVCDGLCALKKPGVVTYVSITYDGYAGDTGGDTGVVDTGVEKVQL